MNVANSIQLQRINVAYMKYCSSLEEYYFIMLLGFSSFSQTKATTNCEIQ